MRTTPVSAILVLAATAFGAQPGFRDDFNGPSLDARWEWYTPAAGPLYEFIDDDFVLSLPAGNFDTWVGFDNMPRLRTTALQADADFRIETSISVKEPAVADYFHTGLWIEFVDQQGGPVDGWFYGFYSMPGWAGNHTILTERVGDRSRQSAENFPVPWGSAEAFLKIERVGDTYSFYYRETADGFWQILHTATAVGQTVTHVGLFAKNYGTRPPVRSAFDFFLLGDAENVKPDIEQPADAAAFVDITYCTQVRILAGYPPPTLEISVAPQPSSAPSIDAQGFVEWTPGVADAGRTFTFTAKATNAVGSDSVSWTVAVKDALRDDFDGPGLAAGFSLYTPAPGPTLAFENGWALLHHDQLSTNGQNFDTWQGFDRMPRIQASVPLCGDFVVETVLNVREVTVGGVPTDITSFQTGIWIGFAGGTVEGFLWGLFTQRANLRLERTGVHFPDLPINATDELGLRVERRGDLLVFRYREAPDGDWLTYGSQSAAGLAVDTIGLFSKNWLFDNPAVTVAFDYFSVAAPTAEPPKLRDLCPQATHLATVGVPFVKRLRYVAGLPLETTIAVAGEGSFDPATELYSFVPAAAGETSVTITATMPGTPPASVTFKVCATAAGNFYEEFDAAAVDDLDPRWMLYNPASIDPSPFSIVDGVFQITTGATPSYDHWTNVDQAPQVQLKETAEPLLAGDFTIETTISLVSSTPGSPFHTGLIVGYGPAELYYWGFYNGTMVRLERTGVNALADFPNTDTTVTLRIARDCTDTLFFMLKPENGDWQQSAAFSVPLAWRATPDDFWVGTILKTYGGGAAVTVGFEYFDIVRGACGIQEPRFRRGDVNIDKGVNIADAISLLSHLFAKKPKPACPDSADANDDGTLNIADAIRILGTLFGGAGPLPAPYLACGVDPKPDTLTECVFPAAFCP